MSAMAKVEEHREEASAPNPEGDGLRSLSLDRLEDEICDLAAHIWAATCRWLCLVAEFERREGWKESGCVSCAHWLSWRCGLAPGAAREQLRVARRLGELPRIREAFARGELSYSKVRAVTRVASSNTEEDLLMLAEHATAAQLERLVRCYRGVVMAELARQNRSYRERELVWWWDDDGSLVIHGRLPAEDGALLLRALEAGRDEMRAAGRGGDAPDVSAETPAEQRSAPQTADVASELRRGWAHGPDSADVSAETRREGSADVSAETRREGAVSAQPADGSAETRGSSGVAAGRVDVSAETPSDRKQSAPDGPDGPDGATGGPAAANADALVLMAETLLASGPRTRTASERVQLVVHVDTAVLADGAPDGRCELEEGPALAAETARRLACDADLITVIERQGRPRSVGRKTRTIPPALRRALRSRDGGCRFPGCDRRRFTDAHHLEHWAEGGESKLANLVLLCRHHHRLLHEHGYGAERLGRGIVFRRPDGGPLPHVPAARRGDPHELIAQNRRRGLELGPHTPIAKSGGERMDYDIAVGGLLFHEGLSDPSQPMERPPWEAAA